MVRLFIRITRLRRQANNQTLLYDYNFYRMQRRTIKYHIDIIIFIKLLTNLLATRYLTMKINILSNFYYLKLIQYYCYILQSIPSSINRIIFQVNMSNLSDKELQSFMVGQEAKIFHSIIKICYKDCARILLEPSLKQSESSCLQNCFNKHYQFTEYLGSAVTQLMQGKQSPEQ